MPATVRVILTVMQTVTVLMQQHSKSILDGAGMRIPAQTAARAMETSIVMGIVTGPMQRCSNRILAGVYLVIPALPVQ
jgi:hypothetical protein